MKLFASILTTVGITGAVWGLLHIQPAIADVSTEQPMAQSSKSESSNKKSSVSTPYIDKPEKAKRPVTANTTYLQGLSKTILLEDMPDLWVDFYQNLEANDEKIAQQQKVVVIA